jgi:hypothetical protein
LKVPNYFPTRQPQHAHMSNEHSLLHQPTWHTPTTEPMKTIPHSHIFSLEQMLSDRQFPRNAPGVDLSVTRNGSQNGEIFTSPISLSVRDTNKINSLPVSALDIQPVEVGPTAIKPVSPGLKSISPGLSADSKSKRSSKRVDSILERLNPNLEKPSETVEKDNNDEKPTNRSVIVQAASSHDENSNSSSILNVPTPTNLRDDDVVSPYSNEDSLDSNKSRRKRKPSKTVRVPKEEDKPILPDQSTNPPEVKKDDNKTNEEVIEEKKIPERRRSSDDAIEEVPAKTRRKTSSESETIDNIAAMVQEGLKVKPGEAAATPEDKEDSKAISVSVIKTKDNLQEALISETSDLSNSSNNVTTTAQKKATNTQFVEVENKLEEMFAGIEDNSDPLKTDNEAKVDDLPKLEENAAATNQDNVTSTSNDLTVAKKSPKKGKRKQRRTQSRRNSENSTESTPKKRTGKKAAKAAFKTGKTKKNSKIEAMKDVYAYDSGSNASSSKSRGPFIQIRGPRDSPLSVSVINTPTNDDDPEKKTHKNKKFHDDSEYRHKVRSKGLHCSTLSNQYDAQTKDASWICAFCKRGPHATETTGPTLNTNIPAPGDLFGPYFITTNSPEFERRLDDPYDKQFKSKKIARTLDNNAIGAKIIGKKFKRKHSLDLKGDEDVYLGITDTGNGTYEIWAHEDCIVWAAGVYLVGPKIIGLEEAVWTSCNVMCIKCHIKGANICCLKRGCVKVAHVCCARLTNWQFDEENYKTYCPEHRVL